MKKYFYLLIVFAITCFVGCKDKNAPSGEGYVGGVSTNMSDYVGTWNVEGYQILYGDDKLLCVQFDADSSGCFVVDDDDKGVLVYEGFWEVEYRRDLGEVELVLRGWCGTSTFWAQQTILKTEPNKITITKYNIASQEMAYMYFVRTSANTMQDYIDKYGDKE